VEFRDDWRPRATRGDIAAADPIIKRIGSRYSIDDVMPDHPPLKNQCTVIRQTTSLTQRCPPIEQTGLG